MRERGAAAVEMAFMAMMLFMLAAGVIDIGRALFTNIGVQDAAQEGAMYGSFNSDNETAIVARTVDSTTYPSLTAADVSVSCRGGQVTVRVEHEVDLVTPVVGDFFGGSLHLAGESTAEVFDEDGCP